MSGKVLIIKGADFSAIKIGTIPTPTPTPTTYTITNNLTNCVSSNSATSINANSAFSATITANSGYTLGSVTCTMGGVSQSVNNGVISIASVTGNIVITASATQIVETDLLDGAESLLGAISYTTATEAYSHENYGTNRMLSAVIDVQEYDSIELTGLYNCTGITTSAKKFYSWVLFSGGYDNGTFLVGANSPTDATIDLSEYAQYNNLTLYVVANRRTDGVNPTSFEGGTAVVKGYK